MTFEAQTRRLDSVAQINPPRRIKKGLELPFVEMAALPENSRNIEKSKVQKRIAKNAGAHFQNGDTLLARITPCLENGKTAQVNCLQENEIGEGSTEFIVLCGVNKADDDFIYYLCRDPVFREFAIARMEGTSGRQRVVWQSIASYEFLCPPEDIRRSAAKVLSTIDEQITLLRETNETLEAIAQAIFKSWFVDFDPVKAKAEGRAPVGIDSETAALFPDSFDQCKSGLIPKGWRYVPFGQLLSHTIGGDWGSDAPDEKNATQVAIIRGTDIPDLQSGAASRVPIRYTSQKKLTTRKLQDGDIVLEVSGGSPDQPTGRSLYLTAALLGKYDCPMEPASFCKLLRPISKDIGIALAQHLKYIYGQGETWKYQNQSTGIANFQTTHFLESEMVTVPDEKLISAFAQVIQPLIELGQQEEIKTLSELRDTLLPRLISGKLKLPDFEQVAHVL